MKSILKIMLKNRIVTLIVINIAMGFRNSLTPFPLDDKETKFILDMPGRRT